MSQDTNTGAPTLFDKDTKQKIPLITCGFEVTIQEGYADVNIKQLYENTKECPLETLFMMPLSEEFALNQIDVEFCLPDGTKEYLQTRVVE